MVTLRLEHLETLDQQDSRLLRVQAAEHCIANPGSLSTIELNRELSTRLPRDRLGR
jgi:hypothetical protein